LDFAFGHQLSVAKKLDRLLRKRAVTHRMRRQPQPSEVAA
jgi:hypothetical protein